MEKQKPIKVGSIVKAKNIEGYFKITSIRGGKANLGAIFGNKIYHKGISIYDITESEKEWYSKWQNSESYMSM